MGERLSGRVGLAALVIACLTATPVKAAPPGQDVMPTPTSSPTQTPSPTSTPTPAGGRLPIPTDSGIHRTPDGVTPTLLPPPAGGGRVSVEALYVRLDPSFDGQVIGIVPYNQSIYPIGRNANNTWIAINWSDQRGWVFASLVVWDTNLNFDALPVLAPANLTPLPSDTPAASTSSTVTISPTEGASPTLPATVTSGPTSPSAATETPLPTTVPTLPVLTLTPTRPAAPGLPRENGSPDLIASIPPGVEFGGLAVAGIIGLITGGYLVRRAAAIRETRRYDQGFILSLCPACLEGHVQMDEVITRSFGIPRVSRAARCDNCLSVLREVKPGNWRYTVDPNANPEMAERYKTRHLNDDDLQSLAEAATRNRFQLEVERKESESQLDLSWLDISYEEAKTPSDGESRDDQPDHPQE